MSARDYDYIVVGSGSAGCALAGRLSALDPTRTVLLIEAGESEPEPACDERRIPQPRGRVLGGTSAINSMVWVRGTRADYDGWEAGPIAEAYEPAADCKDLEARLGAQGVTGSEAAAIVNSAHRIYCPDSVCDVPMLCT